MSHILGELPATVHLPAIFFEHRFIDLDCRGPLTIDETSNWGYFVTVITQSHSIAAGQWTMPAIDRPVTVGPLAWICSGALLYNCIIGEGAIVANGTVVRSAEVKPYTMVAGNPARVIARCVGGKWRYSKPKWTVLE